MAYINFQPSDYFNTVLWTTDGTGSKALTTGHSTDMVWIKFRDYAYDHRIYDDVRGVTKKIIPNKTDAESTTADLDSFDTNGFTVSNNLNTSGEGGLVGWSWKANGSGSANTDGSISSTVSANTTAGFSIVTYTGTGANATVGHGLGVAPSVYFVKRTDTTGDWLGYFKSQGAGKNLRLNTTDALDSNTTMWQNTDPTSSVFYVGSTAEANGSSNTFVAYCFAEKKGYSKFGSYTGNGSTDGTFIYTGFKPAFVIIKSQGSSTHWRLLDNKRDTFNPSTKQLFANNNSAEATDANYAVDFLSNGFKHRNSNSDLNQNAVNYIYMAFAEEPLVSSNNVPATAR